MNTRKICLDLKGVQEYKHLKLKIKFVFVEMLLLDSHCLEMKMDFLEFTYED